MANTGIARQYMAGTGTDWAVVKQPRHFVAMRSVHLCGYVRRGNASHGPAGGLTGQSLNNPDTFMPMHGIARKGLQMLSMARTGMETITINKGDI